MPTLLREAGYAFFFRSADCVEPPHMHVTGHGGVAKFWLDPVRLLYARRYTRSEVARITETIVRNEARWLVAWREYCG